MGNIRKYQLSKFKDHSIPGGKTILTEGEYGATERKESFTEIYKFIFESIPKSRIIVLGGADDVCISLYTSKLFSTIIHLDEAIDVQPMFKLQIPDKKEGKFLFDPVYHEHHRSFLREVFKKDQSDWLKQIVFYGLNGSIVSKQDLDLLKNTNVPQQSICFMERDIVG